MAGRRRGNGVEPGSRGRAATARRALARQSESSQPRRAGALGCDRCRFGGFEEAMISAAQIIRQRRSLLACDGKTSIAAERFYRMLERVMPRVELDMARRPMPWDAIPWRAAIHLVLFVHRVDGIEPGLYALARDPGKVETLKKSMHAHFAWE